MIRFSYVFSLMAVCSYCQTKPVQQVVDAENSFAGTSKRTSTKNAFVSFLAPDGIVFSNGQPVNGQEVWSNLEPNDRLLFWWPVNARISQAQDLGFTTGPYYVKQDRTSTGKLANGYYSSVWKKMPSGEWKVAVDLGISFALADTLNEVIDFSGRDKALPVAKSNKDELLDLDDDYTDLLNKQKKSFIKTYFASDARIHRTGFRPFVGSRSFKNIVETQSFSFDSVDGDVAQSGDLGYTYGKVTVRDRAGKVTNLNYLRVWQRRKDGTWEIVLDVIGG